MNPATATPPAPPAPLPYWEVSCAGKAVAEQPARTVDVSITRNGFRFAAAAPVRFWQSVILLLASSHPLTLKLLQWIQQVLAHVH